MSETISTVGADAGRGASNKPRHPARSRSAAAPSMAKQTAVNAVKPGRVASRRAKDMGVKPKVPTAGPSTKTDRGSRPGKDEKRQDLSTLKALLVEPRRKMAEHQALALRSHQSLAGALAATLELCRKLTTDLPALWALCSAEKVRVTAATKKAPCLAVLKLVVPQLEVKTASLYGKVIAHALETGLDAASFRQSLIDDGVVELARRQAKRRHSRAAASSAPPIPDPKRGAAREPSPKPPRAAGATERDPAPKPKRQEPEAMPAAAPAQSRGRKRASLTPQEGPKSHVMAETTKTDLAAHLRKRQKPVLLHGIDAQAYDGMILVIAEAIGGNLYAYDLDADPARVEVSVRAALRHAPLLRRREDAEDLEASALSTGTADADDNTSTANHPTEQEIAS